MRGSHPGVVVLVALTTLLAPAVTAASFPGSSASQDHSDSPVPVVPAVVAGDEAPLATEGTGYEAIRESDSAPRSLRAWDEAPEQILQSQSELAGQLVHQLDRAPDEVGPQDALQMARVGLEHRQAVVDGEPSLEDRLERQHHSLAAAEELLSLSETRPDAEEEPLAMARRATTWQAATLDLDSHDPVPLRGYEEPSQALVELAQRHAAEPDPAQLDGLRGLDELPEPVSQALARVVDAYLALDTATRAAYPAESIEDLGVDGTPGERLAEVGVDLGPVLSTRTQFLGAVMGLRGTVLEHVEDLRGDCEPVQVPPAFSIDVTSCDNSYERDYAFQLDVRGEDTYANKAGGSGCGIFGGVAGVLVDLGLSGDVYADDGGSRSCGVNGGGGTGVGFLFDSGGSDAYAAGDVGTNGGGTGTGVGFLLDAGPGSDTYIAGDEGTNGGGFHSGVGLLLDIGPGPSLYEAGNAGTNGGGEIGVGFLVDVGGSDTYDAGYLGSNGAGAVGNGQGFLLDAGGSDTYAGVDATNGAGSAAGSGFLLDAGIGDDTYTAQVVSNGGGAGFGVGTLVDTGGDDAYSGTASTNGGGVLGGVGFQVDAGTGDDTYQAGSFAANGGGVLGVGFLLDAGIGDDTYTAGDGGTNGGGFFAGRGFLLDAGIGDDTYQAGDRGTNGGGYLGVDELVGVGSLIDTQGDDAYADPLLPGGSCEDCTVVPKGEVGAQVDLVAGCLVGPGPLDAGDAEPCLPPES